MTKHKGYFDKKENDKIRHKIIERANSKRIVRIGDEKRSSILRIATDSEDLSFRAGGLIQNQDHLLKLAEAMAHREAGGMVPYCVNCPHLKVNCILTNDHKSPAHKIITEFTCGAERGDVSATCPDQFRPSLKKWMKPARRDSVIVTKNDAGLAVIEDDFESRNEIIEIISEQYSIHNESFDSMYEMPLNLEPLDHPPGHVGRGLGYPDYLDDDEISMMKHNGFADVSMKAAPAPSYFPTTTNEDSW